MNVYTFYVVRNIISGFALKDNYTGQYNKPVYKSFKEAQAEADRLNKQVSQLVEKV